MERAQRNRSGSKRGTGSEVKNPEDDPKSEEDTQPDVRDAQMGGTIEYGHIYFFYRPKVKQDEVHIIDDVARFHMLLVPHPPGFATYTEGKRPENRRCMNTRFPRTRCKTRQNFHPLSIEKKQLPEPSKGGGTAGGRKETFLATVTVVGDDLTSLEKVSPGSKSDVGVYVVVNNELRVPSERSTHSGYCLSHPAEPDQPQKSLGLHTSPSRLKIHSHLLQAVGALGYRQRSAQSTRTGSWMISLEGAAKKGARIFRFASVESVELLEYEGAELLMMAARAGGEGLETSLGEGRGDGNKGVIDEVMRELHTDSVKFQAEPLEGQWI
ncbi:hypothetical protein B0F90DRAFT_1807553 [Multifurca ochricompacta]|uniref:Uncharacterized protein n=1 Tax=Multifurca ochricompacta TaxID=376703 RepID=A0AAD4MEK0_9AGAM|nr:hypothetical protein B0F90DRAFT_1807553 [Multifurca ochricompacta]